MRLNSHTAADHVAASLVPVRLALLQYSGSTARHLPKQLNEPVFTVVYQSLVQRVRRRMLQGREGQRHGGQGASARAGTRRLPSIPCPLSLTYSCRHIASHCASAHSMAEEHGVMQAPVASAGYESHHWGCQPEPVATAQPPSATKSSPRPQLRGWTVHSTAGDPVKRCALTDRRPDA